MEEKVFPLVSIISVNFNQSKVTCQLLESLRNITYPNIECIIVDNGSIFDSPDIIGYSFPECKLIKSSVNLGFAGGNNLGIRNSRGEFLLFINNDTEVEPGFLEPLVAKLKSDPGIGMVGPKIRYYFAQDTIQYAGYTPFNRITLRQQLIGYHEKDNGQYDQSRETFSVHGAAMMVRRSVVEEVGLMAEMYFLYYEEHDWAERIKKAGYSIYYVPESIVLHKESVSTGKESPLKIYYIARNRFLFARRNVKGLTRFISLIYLSFVAFPKGVVFYILKRRPDLAKATWRAYLWNFLHFSPIRENQLTELIK
jgi:GT2 family glycosyltransferase